MRGCTRCEAARGGECGVRSRAWAWHQSKFSGYPQEIGNEEFLSLMS